MTETLIMIKEYFLEMPNIYRFSSFCDISHYASAKVMEKSGLTYEGTLKKYFVHPNLDNEPRDCVIYAATK